MSKKDSAFIHDSARVDEEVILGERTKVWANAHICKGAFIGDDVVIGENVYIGPNVTVGNGCKVQNNSLLYEGVHLGNEVFIGPNTVTTNDILPEARGDWTHRFRQTFLEDNVSIGARAVLVCGITLRKGAGVAAGAVVTKDVEAGRLVMGNPARDVGTVASRREKYSSKRTES